jgi:hypothetical protein
VIILILHVSASWFFAISLRKANITLPSFISTLGLPTEILLLPVSIFFESFHANLTFFGDVEMEDFSDEVAFVGCRVVGKFVFDCKISP